jgi:tetratricopeptide (TPR) repeat protein
MKATCIIALAIVSVTASCSSADRGVQLYPTPTPSLGISDDVNAHLKLATTLRARCDLDGAIQEYRQALSRNPNLPGVHRVIGTALQAERHFDEAIQEYRRAISLKPNNEVFHNDLGSALLANGNLVEAAQEYRLAASTNPAMPAYRPPECQDSAIIKYKGVYASSIDGTNVLSSDNNIKLFPGHHIVTFRPAGAISWDPISIEIDVEAGKTYISQERITSESRIGNINKGTWRVYFNEE